jgi:hypothetical protein
MLTNHPNLVPRLRKSRSYTSSPPRATMLVAGTALPFKIGKYISYFADLNKARVSVRNANENNEAN